MGKNEQQPSEGVRRHLQGTGQYHAQGSSWTGRTERSGAAVVASGVVKGAKFVLRGGRGSGKHR